MKNGFKTSELYIALAGIGGILLTFAQQNCDISIEKMIGLVGIVITYIAGRTYLKSRVVNQEK